MKFIFPNYSEAQVLVVGDLMLDRYWYGPTKRISPEAPVPIVKVDEIEERPGGAANVAMNIAALGGQTNLVGFTGIDEPAKVLAEKLVGLHVNCDFVSLPNLPTITKLRIMSRGQQLIRLDFEEGFHNVDATPLLNKVKQGLMKAKALILSDYAKGALVNVRDIIDLANAVNVPILVDPKGTDFARYKGATLLTPNLSEFEAVVGEAKTDAQIVAKGLDLIAEHDLKALLVTRSEQGMTLIQPGVEPLHLPTQAREVFDVTGAGDTVISVLAASLAAGEKIEQACVLANAAAGVVVGKLGTSTVSTVELTAAVHGACETGFGVMSATSLKVAIAAAHARGEKVVMTNGCFDILHAGHVAYLNQAAALGKRLIVAVNNDASVTKLKGIGRPVNPVERRMEVLAGLGSVDWVVPFAEDTPQNLIAELLPDVLVKGGDYKVEDIAGGTEVIANGGEVKVLGFEDGCSTTKIIEAIKKQ